MNSGTTYMLTMPEMSSKIRDATKNLKIKVRAKPRPSEMNLTSFTSACLQQEKRCVAKTFQKTFVVGREAGLTSFDSLLTYKGPRAPDVKIDPKNDIALLPYSSGTTGVYGP